MHTPRAPIFNVGRLSDGRYKFSFSTSAGTLFCEISATRIKDGPDSRSDDQKKSEAIDKLKRLVQELGTVLKDLS
jgi:hypothetical protein